MSWSGQDGSCACDRRIDGHQMSSRDPVASRHSAHERQRWNVSAMPDHVLHVLGGVSAAPKGPDITSARSPDFNPSERLWDTLDRRMTRRNPLPQTLSQFLTALQHEWQNIPQRVVQRLIAFHALPLLNCHQGLWLS